MGRKRAFVLGDADRQSLADLASRHAFGTKSGDTSRTAERCNATTIGFWGFLDRDDLLRRQTQDASIDRPKGRESNDFLNPLRLHSLISTVVILRPLRLQGDQFHPNRMRFCSSLLSSPGRNSIFRGSGSPLRIRAFR